MAAREVLVLGAGIVGLSTAIHLRRRGLPTVLVDRSGPGGGASFGNAGLVQREAVFPYPFPRDLGTLARVARNRSVDVVYHPAAMPALAPALWRYWRHSAPQRYAVAVRHEAALIATCLDEHLDLARQAGVTDLLRPIGWHRAFTSSRALDQAVASAERARADHGVRFNVLDGAALQRAEPHLAAPRAGAIHWTDPLSLSDPGALLQALAALFVALGGRLLTGDALALARHGAGWQLPTDGGRVQASDVVVALGAFSTRLTRRWGCAPPLFGKRGYHLHYPLQPGAVLHRPLLDDAHGYLLAPMARGVRLTTGAEFNHADAPPWPVQLQRAEPLARQLLPLAAPVDDEPWLGVRPCMPDMLPVIGPVPGVAGLWCGFGHGHQGLTLGPSTGRLLAELIHGEAPFIDPAPYRVDRFQRP